MACRGVLGWRPNWTVSRHSASAPRPRCPPLPASPSASPPVSLVEVAGSYRRGVCGPSPEQVVAWTPQLPCPQDFPDSSRGHPSQICFGEVQPKAVAEIKCEYLTDCSHETKRRLLLIGKAMTNLDSVLKSRDVILLTKVCIAKAMFFLWSRVDVRAGP